LEATLVANGFDLNDVLVRPYAGVSNLESAASLAKFINEIRPGIPILIHRDRDFMTDKEADEMSAAFAKKGLNLFVTDGSDIEESFASKEHVSNALKLSEGDAAALLNDVLAANQVAITKRFTRKRDLIKQTYYKGRQDDCPSVDALLPGPNVELRHAVGKEIL